MRPSPPSNLRLLYRTQRGAALMVMLVIVVLGITAVLLNSLNTSSLKNARQGISTEAMAQAKAALIGYAIAYPELHPKGNPQRIAWIPGHLPCPDRNSAGNEGDEDPNCGAQGVTVVGYLPWRTLGLPPLRDSWGNCLWYAVSGSFKANPKSNLLNWDSLGQFKVVDADGSTVVMGATAESRPIAVIFSPGPPLPGLPGQQQRTSGTGECGGDYNPSHFLDAVSAVSNASPNPIADGISLIANSGAADTYNDRLLFITRDDIFTGGIEKRKDLATSLQKLREQVAECITVYGNANPKINLPWAAQMALIDYGVQTFQNDRFNDTPNLLVGRIPFHVWNSFQATTSTLTSFTSCTGNSSTGCRLFRPDNCGGNFLPVAGFPTATSGETGQDSENGWFEKWKDHLFFAVAEDFQPSSIIPQAQKCGNPTTAGRKCLYVGTTGPYASIVIFAGKRQTGQSRDTLPNKNLPGNYLEGINATAISNNSPADPGFGKFAHAGNDQIVCIRTNLTVDTGCNNP